MSWHPIVPVSMKRNMAVDVPVAISVVGGGRYKRAVSIQVRPTMLPGFGWFAPASKVAIAIGSADHAGQLRITRGGPFKLRKSGGAGAHKGSVAPLLTLLNSADLAERLEIPPGKHRRTAVLFTAGDGYLDIHLPAWACAAAKPATRGFEDAAAEARKAAAELAVAPPTPPPPPPPAVAPPPPPRQAGKGFVGALAGGLGDSVGRRSAPIPLDVPGGRR